MKAIASMTWVIDPATRQFFDNLHSSLLSGASGMKYWNVELNVNSAKSTIVEVPVGKPLALKLYLQSEGWGERERERERERGG